MCSLVINSQKAWHLLHCLYNYKSMLQFSFVCLFQESRFSKMEKADILEMTVKHLKNVQKQQQQQQQRQQVISAAAALSPHVSSSSTASAATGNIQSRYNAGFRECAQEVRRYLSSVNSLSPEVNEKLMSHLSSVAVQRHSRGGSGSGSSGLAKQDCSNRDSSNCSGGKLVPVSDASNSSAVGSLLSSNGLPRILPQCSSTSSVTMLNKTVHNNTITLPIIANSLSENSSQVASSSNNNISILPANIPLIAQCGGGTQIPILGQAGNTSTIPVIAHPVNSAQLPQTFTSAAAFPTASSQTVLLSSSPAHAAAAGFTIPSSNTAVTLITHPETGVVSHLHLSSASSSSKITPVSDTHANGIIPLYINTSTGVLSSSGKSATATPTTPPPPQTHHHHRLSPSSRSDGESGGSVSPCSSTESNQSNSWSHHEQVAVQLLKPHQHQHQQVESEEDVWRPW